MEGDGEKVKGLPWLESMVCWGSLPGEPGWKISNDSRGATWQQSRKQMWVGGTESLQRLQASRHKEKERRGPQSRAGPGRGEQGRRQEDKQQDACLAALRGHRHVQLDTEGIASLFVSLTQYKQITHGPMEPAKH